MFKKNILLALFVFFPLIALCSSEVTSGNESNEIPVTKCGSDDADKCDTEPVYDEIGIKNKEILKGNPWGKITMTSTPLNSKSKAVAGEEGVHEIEFSINLTCKGGKKIQVAKKTKICSYQKYTVDEEMKKSDVYLLKVDPEANVSQDGKSINVLIKTPGNCSNSSMVLPVSCS